MAKKTDREIISEHLNVIRNNRVALIEAEAELNLALSERTRKLVQMSYDGAIESIKSSTGSIVRIIGEMCVGDPAKLEVVLNTFFPTSMEVLKEVKVNEVDRKLKSVSV